jgi:hypothetical protein
MSNGCIANGCRYNSPVCNRHALLKIFMSRRTHPFYLSLIVLCVVVVLAAASLLHQPQVASFGSRLFLSRLTSGIKEDADWLVPLIDFGAPTFPPNSRIAGVDVSERTAGEAAALVTQALNQWQQPLPLITDTSVLSPTTPVLDWEALGVTLDVPALIAQAGEQVDYDEPVDVAWSPQVNGQRLRAALAMVAPQFSVSLPAQVVVTPGDPPLATFRAAEARSLDVEATARRIEALLQMPSVPITGTVVLRTEERMGTLADLEAALQQQIEQWDGVAGVAVHDLETGEWLGINAGTVFSGASVLKVPILVYSYAKLGSLSPEQQAWADAMIGESNNLTANNLLAAGAGGEGLEAALQGAQEMTTMLQSLGLEHTFMLMPYEAGDWLAVNGLLPAPLPPQEGAAPYTMPGDYLRATPRDMAEFFTMLAQCGDGTGPLLRYWNGALTQAACQEMLDLLKQPHDTGRMVAGIPPGVPVAHKGGWLLDMQASVGIVYSPNRTYVVALYLWRDGLVTDEDASPAPYLGALSHTIYSFYNPE